MNSQSKPGEATGGYMSVNRKEAVKNNWESISKLTLPNNRADYSHQFVKCPGCAYHHLCLKHKICFHCGYEPPKK